MDVVDRVGNTDTTLENLLEVCKHVQILPSDLVLLVLLNNHIIRYSEIKVNRTTLYAISGSLHQDICKRTQTSTQPSLMKE